MIITTGRRTGVASASSACLGLPPPLSTPLASASRARSPSTTHTGPTTAILRPPRVSMFLHRRMYKLLIINHAIKYTIVGVGRMLTRLACLKTSVVQCSTTLLMDTMPHYLHMVRQVCWLEFWCISCITRNTGVCILIHVNILWCR